MTKYDLRDFIFHQKSIIPSELCDKIVADIDRDEWKKHTWYDAKDNNVYSLEDELDISYSKASNDLYPFVLESLLKYQQIHNQSLVYKHNGIRFNRYSPGQTMKKHSDHIRDLFDGNEKGIPVLSVVGNLNDDYEGGEFTFWDDDVVKFGKGDIMIFPSIFLYPHRVEPTTRGSRYSFVCWAY